jgi:hypothetical protein
LDYYRNLEADGVRADPGEGRSDYAPLGGLEIRNITRGKTFALPNWKFESRVRESEIYICCLSRKLSTDLWESFGAEICVEISDVAGFHKRVENALPKDSTLPEIGGRRKLGYAVKYYDESAPPGTRWALPAEMGISKKSHFKWQDEHRLIFGSGNVFKPCDVSLRLATVSEIPNAGENHGPPREIEVGNMTDICRMLSK